MQILIGIAASLGALVLLIALAVGLYADRNSTAQTRRLHRVWRAGFVEHAVEINRTRLVYVEGPDNGPPLLLIHAQGVDWRNYASVLPELSERYHVFAVDCHGHGGSDRTPGSYRAAAIGADLRTFLDRVVGRPAIVSGHSSGGQLAAWLGAYAPDQVSGLVLEDPPLFTTLEPRCRATWNWVDLATTCHTFLQGDRTDFVMWYIDHARMWRLFGKITVPLQRSVRNRRRDAPGSAVRSWFLPAELNEIFRGMQRFDPRFGDAFYTARWNDGFDHDETLSAIRQPTVLIHANWRYSDGILEGAMDDDDAARAMAALPDATLERISSPHDVHGAHPHRFIEVVDQLAGRVAAVRTGARLGG